MLPGFELMGCGELAVPANVMQHVVRVESSFNPYAIGVVGGRLVRQPRSLAEAVSTAKMLHDKGYNFSIGLAQVNKTNFAPQGIKTLEEGFERCANLQAGARILADCYMRANRDWGKAFSCYYSGNFTTGYRHGYVQKVFSSWQNQWVAQGAAVPIPVVGSTSQRQGSRRPPATRVAATGQGEMLPAHVARRIQAAGVTTAGVADAGRTEGAGRIAPPPPGQVVATQVAESSSPPTGGEQGPVTVTAFGAPGSVAHGPKKDEGQADGRDSAFVF